MGATVHVFPVRQDRRRKLSTEQVGEAVRLRQSGLTLKAVGERFGVTGTAILNAIRAVQNPEKHQEIESKRKKSQLARTARGQKIQKVHRGESEADKSYRAEWNRAYMQRRRDARGDLIAKIKAAPCMDCGGVFASCAMHFDHRPGTGKMFNIGERFASVAEDVLVEEIAKCDVVCANCHAVRTHTRRG